MLRVGGRTAFAGLLFTGTRVGERHVQDQAFDPRVSDRGRCGLHGWHRRCLLGAFRRLGWTLGRWSLGRWTLGRWTLGRRSLGRWTLGRWTLGRWTLGRWTLGRRSLGRVVVA